MAKYDYNIVSIGAGSAGLVTSYIGAILKAKVALIERHKIFLGKFHSWRR